MHPTFQFDINSKISGLAPNLDDYENLLVAIKQIKKYQIFKLHNEIQALLGALDLNQPEKMSAFFKVVFCDDIQLMNTIRELNLSEPYPQDEQLSDYLNSAEWPADVYPMAFQLRHAYFLGKYEFSNDPKSKPTSHAVTWLEFQNDKNAASRYIVDFSYLDQALLPVMKKLFSEAKLKNQQYLKVAHDCIGLTQFEIMQYIYGYVNHYQKHHQLPKLPDEVDCTLTEAQSAFINVYTARELREHCLRHDIEQVLIHFEANKNAFYTQFEMPFRKTAAMIAIEEKNTKLAEVLLAEDESFAAKKNIFGNHCLHYAIHHLSATHDEHLFRAWVKKYPNLINLPNNNGETPVYWAVLLGNTRFLSILLEEGASIAEISQTGINALELALAKSRVVDVQLILYFQLMGDFNLKLIANAIKKISIPEMFFASVNESIRNVFKNPTQMTDAQKLSFKRELLRGLTERHYCPSVQEKLIRAGNDDAYLTLLLRTLPNYQQLTNDERWAQILKIENEAKTLRGLSDRLFLMLSYKKPGDVNAELYYQVYRLIKDNNMIDLANVMHHFPTLKKLMTMLESHLTPLQSALQENDVETLKLILRWPALCEHHSDLKVNFQTAVNNGQVIFAQCLGQYLLQMQLMDLSEINAAIAHARAQHQSTSHQVNRNDKVLEETLKINIFKQSQLTLQKLEAELQADGEFTAMENQIFQWFEQGNIKLLLSHATKDLKFIQKANALVPTEDLLDDAVIQQTSTPEILRGNVFFALSANEVVVTNFLREQYDVVQVNIRDAIAKGFVKEKDVWTSMHFPSFGIRRVYPTTVFSSACGRYATYYRIAHQNKDGSLSGRKFHEFDYVQLQPEFKHLDRRVVPVSHDFDICQGDPTVFVAKKFIWFLRCLQSTKLPTHYGSHLQSLFEAKSPDFFKEIQDCFNNIFTPYNFELKISEPIHFDSQKALDLKADYFVRFVENPLAVMAMNKLNPQALFAKLKVDTKESFFNEYKRQLIGHYNNPDLLLNALAECSAEQVGWLLELGVDVHNHSKDFLKVIMERYYNAFLNESLLDIKEAKAILNMMILQGSHLPNFQSRQIRNLVNVLDTRETTEAVIELAIMTGDDELLSLMRTVFIRRDVTPFYMMDPNLPLSNEFQENEVGHYLQEIEQSNPDNLGLILKQFPEKAKSLNLSELDAQICTNIFSAIYHRLLLRIFNFDSGPLMLALFNKELQVEFLKKGVHVVSSRCLLVKSALTNKVDICRTFFTLNRDSVGRFPFMDESQVINFVALKGLLSNPSVKKEVTDLRPMRDPQNKRISDNYLFSLMRENPELVMEIILASPNSPPRFNSNSRLLKFIWNVERLHDRLRLFEKLYEHYSSIDINLTQPYIRSAIETLEDLQTISAQALPWEQPCQFTHVLLLEYLNNLTSFARLKETFVRLYTPNLSSLKEIIDSLPETEATYYFLLTLASRTNLEQVKSLFDIPEASDRIGLIHSRLKLALQLQQASSHSPTFQSILGWMYFLIKFYLESGQTQFCENILLTLQQGSHSVDTHIKSSGLFAPYAHERLPMFFDAYTSKDLELARIYAQCILKNNNLEEHFSGDWNPNFLAQCLDVIASQNPDLLTDATLKKVDVFTTGKLKNQIIKTRLEQLYTLDAKFELAYDNLSENRKLITQNLLQDVLAFFQQSPLDAHLLTNQIGVRPCVWNILERVKKNYLLETDSLYPLFYPTIKNELDFKSDEHENEVVYEIGPIKILLLTGGLAKGRTNPLFIQTYSPVPVFFSQLALSVKVMTESRVRVDGARDKSNPLTVTMQEDQLTLCTMLSNPHTPEQISQLNLNHLMLPARVDADLKNLFLAVFSHDQTTLINLYEKMRPHQNMQRLSQEVIIAFPYVLQSLQIRIQQWDHTIEKWNEILAFIKIFYEKRSRTLLSCAVLANNEPALDYLLSNQHLLSENLERAGDAFLLALAFNRVKLAKKLIANVSAGSGVGYLKSILCKFIEPDVYSGFTCLKSARLINDLCDLFTFITKQATHEIQRLCYVPFSIVQSAMTLLMDAYKQGSKAEFLNQLRQIQSQSILLLAMNNQSGRLDFHTYLLPNDHKLFYSLYQIEPSFQEAALQLSIDADTGLGSAINKPGLVLSQTAVDWHRVSDPEFVIRARDLYPAPPFVPQATPQAPTTHKRAAEPIESSHSDKRRKNAPLQEQVENQTSISTLTNSSTKLTDEPETKRARLTEKPQNSAVTSRASLFNSQSQATPRPQDDTSTIAQTSTQRRANS